MLGLTLTVAMLGAAPPKANPIRAEEFVGAWRVDSYVYEFRADGTCTLVVPALKTPDGRLHIELSHRARGEMKRLE